MAGEYETLRRSTARPDARAEAESAIERALSVLESASAPSVDQLSDLADARRVAALAHRGADDLQDFALTHGEIRPGTGRVVANSAPVARVVCVTHRNRPSVSIDFVYRI